MENITGNPVTDKDFLKTRLFLVDDLKESLKKCSVIIEAPRRFGKTSVIKELKRQEEARKNKEMEFNVLFLELEGEATINDFCFKLFKELLNLYRVRKKIDSLSELLGSGWNAFASRLRKIKLLGLELELREKTRNYDFATWKEEINSLINHLDSFEKKTIIVFDEFPDMLLNFKKQEPDEIKYKDMIDGLTAWLRSLRQAKAPVGKYQFVFCGSIHLRNTLEELGISKRINDLESFVIPPIKNADAQLLIESLTKKYNIEIEAEGVAYMVSKITDGSVYYGQILVKALRETGERNFSGERVRAIYKAMLEDGHHDLNHHHSRLESYISPVARECSKIILKHLCGGRTHEKKIYDLFLFDKCSYEEFQSVVRRLIYEGYICRDIDNNGSLRFVSHLLKDWWACKMGIKNVCL